MTNIQNGKELEVAAEYTENGDVRTSILDGQDGSNKVKPHPIWCSTRMAIAILCCWNYLNAYAQRVNISVAIVCMVNHTAVKLKENGTSLASDNGTYQSSNITSNARDGEFDWDKSVQGNILGSFFFGYIATQFLGGIISTRFGGKRVLGWSMLVCSLATLLIPVGARLHYGVILFLRIISGLGQGVIFPAGHALWSKWCPPHERSRLIGFGFAGSQLGTILAMPISGLLCHYGFDGGWPSIFYLFGGLGVLWFFLWMYVVADSPAEHPRVSMKERKYIENNLVGELVDSNKKTPWFGIITSVPVWGIIICHTCFTFGFYTFLTNLPTYLKEVLKFDVKSNGMISALPYLGCWLLMMASTYIADYMRVNGVFSLTWIRRLVNTISQAPPIMLLIILGYLDANNTTLAVILLIFGVAFNGITMGAGFIVNTADIAPSYAGIIFGISNTFATVPGFVAPNVVGYLTKNQTQAEWQAVFYLNATFYAIGTLCYFFMCSGEIQPWARDDNKTKHEDEAALELANQ